MWQRSSGHGTTDRDKDYYFLAQDTDPNNLRRTAVANAEFAKTLSHVEGKALFFFDTCRSGSVSLPDVDVVANTLSSAEHGNVWVFAASISQEAAIEQPALQNGAFTSALVDALMGRADASTYRNGKITAYLPA
jgi:uncharacterized caspase-like protein